MKKKKRRKKKKVRNNTKAANFDTIIFDLDGVLVDVSNSYLVLPFVVTQKFYNEILGLDILKVILDTDDVTYIKNIGGFNNDWDITYYFIDVIFQYIFPEVNLKEELDIKHKVSFLKDIVKRERMKYKEVNVKNIVKGIFSGNNNNECFKLSRWLKSGSEDIKENMIKRLFQEMYLGKDNLKKHYNLAPMFYDGKGYISKEKLLISRKIIKNLSSRHMLALATGRDRVDTELCLKIQDLKRFFKVKVTDDDVIEMELKNNRKISLRKPNPFIVEKAINDIKSRHKRILYIGDNLDDVRAANSLKNKYEISSAGVLYETPDKKEKEKLFNKLGVDIIFHKPQDLLKI